MFEGYKKVNKKHYAWLIILLSPIYLFVFLISFVFGGIALFAEATLLIMNDLTKR